MMVIELILIFSQLGIFLLSESDIMTTVAPVTNMV